jgi:proteic killer suppression protein
MCKATLYIGQALHYTRLMIRSFRSRALKAPWEKGQSGKIAPELVGRATRRLDALDAATSPEDMNLPGFDFHKLRGRPLRYSVHVNGPWCITFEWDGDGATAVDFENYH